MADTDLTVHDARRMGTWTVAAVTGEIDFSSADALYSQARRLISEGPGCLLLDFSAVTFCDSSGISSLIGLMREARIRHGTLALAAAPERVSRALHQIGLHHFIPVYPDIEAALAAAPGAPPPCGSG
ncbi:anti-sigma factor antagonist [Streptomyces albofaciens JCM 4342]|uniref:STAS domain-containing protein n=1 Tax=Streptomyces albofaciens TaxID=66866 RepID=UPI00123A4A9F|nr:STAS domain-containing protein [Streptomyces albofaciens]KAA6223765.1 anti-sigma factor antagonist [Streptomyces albofaciens JCM 4342]